MRKGLMILVALSIALLMSASMLVAQEKAAVEKEKGTCKKEMKITDEQKTKIEEMKMSLRMKMIDLKAEREKLAIMLKKEMTKPEPAMQEIEAIVKKMSAVREKIQLAGIEHKLAMRKLGFSGAGKGGFSWMEKGEECKMPAGRRKVVRMDGSGCDMEGGAPHAMSGKGAMGACHGEEPMQIKRMIMMKNGGGCSSSVSGKWSHRMFRPFGRKEHASMMSSCGMEKGAMKCDMKCGMKAGMKGGCMMGKGAAAAGCAKECTGKETECKIKIKKEIKKAIKEEGKE